MAEYEVYLQGGSPWGFRLQGGKEFRVPLKIAKVEPGGKADIAGVKVGDQVLEINGVSTEALYHTEALTTVKRADYSLSLVLNRPKAPVAKSQSNENISKSNTNYHEYDEADFGPVDRERSKTLPKKSSNKSIRHDDDMIYSTNSLGRSGSTSSQQNGGPPGKAPAWYKQMYKEMHSSMEGESHLTKLLSSDAKRGAFRKYDGATTIDEGTRRQSSATVEDAPRRLHGGGRSAALSQHRKSLPNLHASNFNFMIPNSMKNSTPAPITAAPAAPAAAVDNSKKVSSTQITVQTRQKKPGSVSSIGQKQENRKSVNHEWYRQLQKGGEIPEVGLAAAKPASTVTKISVPSASSASLRKEPTPNKSFINKSEPIIQASNATVAYNAPPDFLELRKQELKNKDVEKERESVRQIRERERLAEEEKFKKKQDLEKKRYEEERKLGLENTLITPMEIAPVQSAPVHSEPTQSHRQKEERKPLTHLDISKELEELTKEVENLLPSQYARAKYAFHPQGPGELEFRKGEMIHLLQIIDENWMEGEIDGTIGIFPSSYVEFKTIEEEARKNEKSQSTVKTNTSSKSPTKSQQEKPTLYVEPTKPTLYVEPTVKVAPVEQEYIEPLKETIVETTPSYEVEVQQQEPLINIEPGFGKAKYTFKAETDNELNFKKGDMIKLLRQIDDNWFEGENANNVGILPASYIEVLQEPVVTFEEIPLKTKEIVREEFKPIKQIETQSSIDFDEIFKLPSSNGYHEIESKNNSYNSQDAKISSQNEIIDTNYSKHDNYSHNNNDVDMMTKTPVHSEPTIDDLTDGLIGQGEPHVARYSYNQTNEDEVTLKKGDIVHVLEKCDDGWFVGTNERTGGFGIFPGNYVTIMT